MKEKKKNISTIIYMTISTIIISWILQVVCSYFITDSYILDGCGWSDGSELSLECKINYYLEPLELVISQILNILIAAIISYKLIFNKNKKLSLKDSTIFYIILEIILISTSFFMIKTLMFNPYYFQEITQKVGITAIVLQIILSVGLFIIVSWLLNKIIYQKRVFKNKNITIFPLILGIIILSVSFYLIYSNIFHNL